MQVPVVIPARGGSKGLPSKNLQTLGGLPLIAWAVRAALAARRVDGVYVSTDSGPIAAAARAYGAQVIERPPHLARDETPTLPVIAHALEQIGGRPEAVAVVQCTSPLTLAEDVDGAIDRLGDDCDAVASVTECCDYLVSGAGELLNISGDERGCRRQDRTRQYRLNGSVFVWRLPLRDMWLGKLGLYEMPPDRSIDIDGPLDLEVAELLARRQAAWIVCGAGPDAPQMLALARARHPQARIITTNEGISLFPAPDRPDVYFLTDSYGCQIYHDQAMAAQQRGTWLVTPNREARALKTRRVDQFDEFAGGFEGTLSGLMCLEYAVHHGARQIHLVGMNGYTGEKNGDYFDGHEPTNTGAKRITHTQVCIEPFTQRLVASHPEVEFTFYGRLNYRVQGENVRRICA